MARNLREVIAAVAAERRAKVAAAYRQKLIALKKKRQLEEAKRVLELDSNLIAIAVIITALPIIAALGWMSLWGDANGQKLAYVYYEEARPVSAVKELLVGEFLFDLNFVFWNAALVIS